MKRILLILILPCFAQDRAFSQLFTVDNLLNLPSLSQNSMDRSMNKIGFSSHKARLEDNLMMTSYVEKSKPKSVSQNRTGSKTRLNLELERNMDKCNK